MILIEHEFACYLREKQHTARENVLKLTARGAARSASSASPCHAQSSRPAADKPSHDDATHENLRKTVENVAMKVLIRGDGESLQANVENAHTVAQAIRELMHFSSLKFAKFTFETFLKPIFTLIR